MVNSDIVVDNPGEEDTNEESTVTDGQCCEVHTGGQSLEVREDKYHK